MTVARVFAVLVIVGVGAAAFRLSFATLADLAELANIPASDAWLFPLIVDGTICLATLGTLVLAKSPERRFFLWVLGAGAVVSVAGNSLHAVTDGRPLPGWAAALVAAIAPISLLVDTHGLAVLFRAAQRNSSTAPEAVTEPEPEPETVTEPEAVAVAPEPAPVSEPASVPVPEPVTEPLPVPTPAPAPAPAPRALVRPVRPVPVRPRPVQPPMLPLAVPVGGH
ncbi:DUF2637 domain-containing protein [Nocardia cyriacigeorgica]|nr:DUF2637 domain-containing protein [Nocardia cyriacigeorgica]MBF6092358.1 DUF2637 domain-containing protein [Nocardia cyriacigeorgica]MBF6162910.1 DUF2637 domain-containing protein [Nocardia cyriacigeorgica]MBF6201790.1 DUF2637 domain-containing protein [Nocardia cyriacigeorgica]MBF6315355.1 DUF2637 domain-containing protein [Nocardia cyriacigeorgica]MBF6530141.1 DUF2637 domain-containing protein [Nocardia cyriacigeorgica]